MANKIVLLGCGSANLFAALYLVDKGYPPTDITIIEQGSDPITRTSLLKGFAGAGLFSDSKWVFSLHEDPLSEHITVEDKAKYHEVIQGIIKAHFPVEEHMISVPVDNSKVEEFIPSEYGMTLKQSVCWHLGTDNGLSMARSMYHYLLNSGVVMLFKHTVQGINLERRIVSCKIPTGFAAIHYDILQVGLGKTGVNAMDTFIDNHNIPLDFGYANVGGRFETKMNDKLTAFSNEVQYDFKLTKEYGDNMSARNFCVCHNSAYVVQEGIDGVCTFNGHAYGKFHDKQNGMTNFGVMIRVKGTNALELHRAILSKHGKGGEVVRGSNWDGESTIKSVGRELTWEQYRELYSDIEFGTDIVDAVRDFVEQNDKLFGINGNYSLYIPEVKMAAGVIITNSTYNCANGMYPEVSFVGDGTSGSVGLTPSAMTGIRGVERLVRNKVVDDVCF